LRKTMHMPGRRLIISASTALALAACSPEPTSGGLTQPGDMRTVWTDQPGEAAGLLNRAEELRARGELVAALSVLSEAQRRFPKNAGVLSAYGRTALALGHDDLAAPLLERAVASNPGDWRALSAKGVLEARRGKLPDGQRYLAKARPLSAGDAVILNNLAVSHLLEGKPAAAASLLRQALAAPGLRSRHERRLKRNLALALALQGRLAEAESLAGEKLPRKLAEGDMGTLRRLLGVSDPHPAGPASGWTPRIATTAQPDQPAFR
jgi:Flp pilus assembly protein TadD